MTKRKSARYEDDANEQTQLVSVPQSYQQTIEIGTEGYISVNDGNNVINHVKIVDISGKNIILVFTETYDPQKIKKTDFQEFFAKDKIYFEVIHHKKIWNKLNDHFEKQLNLSMTEFMNKSKEFQSEYPELWL